MYAVVKTGGKQYRVSAGEKLKIEQIPADVGAEIVLDQVLLIADGDAVRMGTPLLDGAQITARVLAHGRGTRMPSSLHRRKPYAGTQAPETTPRFEILRSRHEAFRGRIQSPQAPLLAEDLMSPRKQAKLAQRRIHSNVSREVLRLRARTRRTSSWPAWHRVHPGNNVGIGVIILFSNVTGQIRYSKGPSNRTTVRVSA